jgi:hypothetical protein
MWLTDSCTICCTLHPPPPKVLKPSEKQNAWLAQNLQAKELYLLNMPCTFELNELFKCMRQDVVWVSTLVYYHRANPRLFQNVPLHVVGILSNPFSSHTVSHPSATLTSTVIQRASCQINACIYHWRDVIHNHTVMNCYNDTGNVDESERTIECSARRSFQKMA